MGRGRAVNRIWSATAPGQNEDTASGKLHPIDNLITTPINILAAHHNASRAAINGVFSEPSLRCAIILAPETMPSPEDAPHRYRIQSPPEEG
jgi:hypothetical protein